MRPRRRQDRRPHHPSQRMATRPTRRQQRAQHRTSPRRPRPTPTQPLPHLWAAMQPATRHTLTRTTTTIPRLVSRCCAVAHVGGRLRRGNTSVRPAATPDCANTARPPNAPTTSGIRRNAEPTNGAGKQGERPNAARRGRPSRRAIRPSPASVLLAAQRLGDTSDAARHAEPQPYAQQRPRATAAAEPASLGCRRSTTPLPRSPYATASHAGYAGDASR